LIECVGDVVSVGEFEALGDAVPVGGAVQFGDGASADEVAQGGKVVPADVGIVTEGDGKGVETEGVGERVATEGVGEGVVPASPWPDGGDDCPTTAAARTGSCFWRWSADCNPKTADLCGNSLRVTCVSVRTETKRATFSGDDLGRSGRMSVRTAVMAPASAPMLMMILVTVPRSVIALVTRFHRDA
jgi:hypothetical protein